jgi:hypothetical protein
LGGLALFFMSLNFVGCHYHGLCVIEPGCKDSRGVLDSQDMEERLLVVMSAETLSDRYMRTAGGSLWSSTLAYNVSHAP